MWGMAQPGCLAFSCSCFPVDLPEFILCPLPPPSRECTKSHSSLLQKEEFIFNSAWGGGVDFNGRELQPVCFSYRNREGAIKQQQRCLAWADS